MSDPQWGGFLSPNPHPHTCRSANSPAVAVQGSSSLPFGRSTFLRAEPARYHLRENTHLAATNNCKTAAEKLAVVFTNITIVESLQHLVGEF
ncbi:hypothetical protein GN956_G15256 [Arapaima gigas]